MYNVAYPAQLFPGSRPRYFFIVVYLGRVLGGSLMLNEEVTEFGWFDPNHLPADLMPTHDQRIRDAL
jgi:hypothetical protein